MHASKTPKNTQVFDGALIMSNAQVNSQNKNSSPIGIETIA